MHPGRRRKRRHDFRYMYPQTGDSTLTLAGDAIQAARNLTAPRGAASRLEVRAAGPYSRMHMVRRHRERATRART